MTAPRLFSVRSSRSGADATFREAVDRGLAPDGGLYLPSTWPTLDAPPRELGPTPGDTAAWAAPLLLKGALDGEVLARVVRDALDFPIPLTAAGPDLELLELFHGPTRAFKDVGARFLARLWAAEDREPGRRRNDHTPGGDRLVLVATSGDTGGAVADACHGLPGIRVAVLFPAGRVSPLQRRQFTTLGENVLAIAVDGPFDRCQQLVKEVLRDPDTVSRLGLTSANSINLGRLLPQVLYYLHLARLRGWGRSGVVSRPVVVPSGNLGNVTAGLLAVRAGAPLGRLVAACNENDVLVRYLADGRTTEAPVVDTMSSAMDVGRPSNLERLVALAREDGGGDAGPPDLGVEAASASEDEAREAMARAWKDHGILLDPHTAVGVAVARRRCPGGATVLATAHPAKFPDAVEAATGERPTDPVLEALMDREEHDVRLTGGTSQLTEILDAWRR